MSMDKKKALDAGCGDFDSKPVNLPRLLGKIEALMAVPKSKRLKKPADPDSLAQPFVEPTY